MSEKDTSSKTAVKSEPNGQEPIPPWYDTTIPQWFKDFLNPPLAPNQAVAAGPGEIPSNQPGLSKR